jgi:hypothetical protein
MPTKNLSAIKLPKDFRDFIEPPVIFSRKEKNELDRKIYTSEPVQELIYHLEETLEFLDSEMTPKQHKAFRIKTKDLYEKIKMDSLCAHTDV